MQNVYDKTHLFGLCENKREKGGREREKKAKFLPLNNAFSTLSQYPMRHLGTLAFMILL